ncbi:MAG: HDOD domain-containing protein [Planctomycetes bacterium]|nr:HDOD domain-containing protein [Planctomycetota bacterium]
MNQSIDKEAIRSRIQKGIDEMPSMSPAVEHIIEMANDLTSTPKDLLDVIKTDPVLTTKILRLVNSAYFSLNSKIASLNRALVLLGFNTIKNIALSTEFVKVTEGSPHNKYFSYRDLWEHLLAVGVVSKMVAKEVQKEQKSLEEFFIAGLVHDLGEFLIMRHAMIPELKLETPMDLVTFARQSENSLFVGGQCGWLDQMLIVNSKDGQLTKIDYADNGIQHFESKLPESWQFVAINTNVPHVLAESDYNHRVEELTLALNFLSSHFNKAIGSPTLCLDCINTLITKLDPTAESLGFPESLSDMQVFKDEKHCDISDEEITQISNQVEAYYNIPDLPEHKGKSNKESFAILLKRVRHQKMSSLIVPMAGEAALKGDADLFGLLLDLEGRSLRMSGDFQITGDNGAQDALLDECYKAAKALDIKVHGRMLGGGGGGNVLLFANKENNELYEEWKKSAMEGYNNWAEKSFPGKGIRASVIEPVISAGAELL